MTAIKSWLLSVVACGFLTALAQTLPLNKTGKRALTLVCGCLTVLAVLRPLLGLRGIARVVRRFNGVSETYYDPQERRFHHVIQFPVQAERTESTR